VINHLLIENTQCSQAIRDEESLILSEEVPTYLLLK